MAARYWVGGSDIWDGIAGTKWALTSGGAGGQSVPGAADTVFFDAASGAVTCTWSASSPTVLSITCTGFTGTLATGGNSKTLAGAGGTVWTSPVGCTITGAPTMTVNYNGASLVSVTCNHASPSAANAPNFTFSLGTYVTSLSGTGFRNITFSAPQGTAVSGTISLYGSLTILGTTRTFTGLAPTFLAAATFTSGGKTIGSTTVNAPGATVTTSGALTLGTTSTFTLTAGTLSVGATLSTGIFSSSNTNTRAIAFGANNIALTSTTASTTVLSMATATGFTFTGTGAFTRNMAATATVTFGTTGGTTSNAPNLTVNAGASALTITSGSYFKNLIFTGSTSTVTAGDLNMAGNLTLASGGTYTGVAPTFLASGTLTSVGKTLSSTTVNGSGITTTLAAALTLTNALTLTQGTFTAADFNVAIGSFSSNNSNTRTLNMGSGTWTISGSGASAWNTATTTGLTFSPSTSTITMTSASAKTFAGGGLTYYILNQGGAGALTVSDSNTFTTISNSVQPTTFTFTSGTTQTVTNFNVSGTVGNLVTIGASTTSAATLSKASGTVNSSYLSLSYSTATGGAVWNALNSTDGGNNTGWIFAIAPVTATSNMFLMFV